MDTSPQASQETGVAADRVADGGCGIGRVGFLFSGQTNPVHEAELRNAFATLTTPLVAGALNGLSAAQIDAMRPQGAEARTATELADGSEITVRMDALLERLQRAVDGFAADGASLIVLLSTGEYPELHCPVPAILPSRVLDAVVATTLPPASRIGILLPQQEQIPHVRRKWERLGHRISLAPFSPWQDPEQLDRAAAALAADRPDLVVMDCFGYTAEHRARLQRHLRTYALLPRDVVIPIVLNMLGTSLIP